MTLNRFIIIVGSAAGMIAPSLALGQGVVTFIDNTGQPIAGNNGVGLSGVSQRLDIEFQTGTNALGYILNSVSFLMSGVGNTGGAAQIGVLNPDDTTGVFIPFVVNSISNPTNTGLYTYTVPSVTLSPDTDYWLMLNNKGTGVYQWSYTSSTAGSALDGWTILSTLGPPGENGTGVPMFAISATAVPEPTSSGLVVAGALSFFCLARFRRVSKPGAYVCHPIFTPVLRLTLEQENL